MEEISIILSVVLILLTVSDLAIKYLQWKTWEKIAQNGDHKRKKK